jgi:hypothetical protein
MSSIKIEKEIILNDNDKNLVPIRVDILDIINRTYKKYGKTPPNRFPRLDKIDNYGLPRDEQLFKYQTYPQRLKLLEEGLRTDLKKELKRESPQKREQLLVEAFWEHLDTHQDEYKNEIEWIELQWYRRLFGYWFINDSVATYITGKHYFYLNFFEINAVGKPQYRERDRLWWIAKEYAELETRTFKFRDKDGRGIPNPDGTYEMIETGKRVFLGIISAKARRVGDTSKSACNLIEEGTKIKEVHLGVQSVDASGAENVFEKHITMPFRKLPLIFKPAYKRLNLREAMRFDSDECDSPLNTTIDYASSRYGIAYDGKTLHCYYGDEAGKLEEELITLRHQQIKPCCCEQGGHIKGNIIYTTTVEDMSKSAGKNFLEFCKNSMWEQRIDNGQTKTGMLTIFFRGSAGAPDFVDKFGRSVEYDPTPEQKEELGIEIGAIEYFKRQRALLKDEELAKIKRQIPLEFSEIFTPPAKSIFFPVRKISDRLQEINFAKHKYYRRGNFVWRDKFGSSVEFIDNEFGRFFVSKLLAPDESNRIVKINGEFAPEFPDRFVCSADTFKLENSTGNQMSDGGIAVFQKRDPLIDPDGKDVSLWQTNNWVMSYRYRPATLDLYCEDVLMACIYYGCYLYPENNISNLSDYFIQKGYGKMLLYATDPSTGYAKPLAGFNSTVATKQKLFNLMRSHLELHVGTCKLPHILQECLDIGGLAEMTFYDLFCAAGGCLLALESQQIQQEIERRSITNDISDWYIEHEY